MRGVETGGGGRGRGHKVWLGQGVCKGCRWWIGEAAVEGGNDVGDGIGEVGSGGLQG